MINKSKITDQINIGPLDTQFEEILDEIEQNKKMAGEFFEFSSIRKS